MTRAKITQNGEFTGNWFNPDAAILHKKEESDWNGRNWISRATSHQFYHEGLYYSKSKNFILNRWSDFQGSQDTYELITASEAAEWIIKNEFDDLEFLDQLPAKVKEDVSGCY